MAYNIDIKTCGYSLYKIPITSSLYKGVNNYIPILIIEVPQTLEEIQNSGETTIFFTNTTGLGSSTTYFAITGNDINLNVQLPYWSEGSGSTGVFHTFLDVYEQEETDKTPYILYSHTISSNNIFYTGSIYILKDTAIQANAYFNGSFTTQSTSSSDHDGFIGNGVHFSDDKYICYNSNALSFNNPHKIIADTNVIAGTKGLYDSASSTIFYSTALSITQDATTDLLIRRLLGKSKKYDQNDPNDGSGNSRGGGGGGTSDIGGDEHPTGGTPTISPLDSGLLTLYNPTVDQLQSLGKFLWSDSFDVTAFKKLFNDPFDTLLGLSIVPVKPNISGTHDIIFGNLDSGVSSSVVASPWVTVDCGTFELNEVWHGALDYSPSTQVSIYLPFIGVKQLNTNDVMGSTLHLIYNFDVLTGACVAEISINHTSQGNKSDGFSYTANMGSVYTFVGQCAINVPLASQDFTNTIRAAIGAAGVVAGVGASIATGNAALGAATTVASQTAIKAGMTTAAIGGAAQGANLGMQATTPTVERSGALTSSAALLASLTPCLIVARPHICKPENYYALRGVPSQVYLEKLSKATGFLQIADIHNIRASGATDSELDEIKGYLSQGVYVTTWPTSVLSKTDTLDIQLYNNTSAKNRIDKSLTGIRSGDNALEGTFRDSCDLENPVVQIKINDVSDLNHCNYMYIGMFQRYYYITKIVSYRNNVVEITGHVDPLMTYGYQIGQNSSILARSSQVSTSGYGNTYLDDAQLATYNDTYNVCYNWGYSFSHSNDSLILAVAGALSS